ncbi:lysosome-associated membrane glycoprotein 1 [Coregonus clupeaformis]|uniref:lysosome-associated membrane glycoprotein 1 n=1 Tax=Coregonus clupeaformis TaxID=59861 RepID=UPI001BE01FFF|nr:lysosome-associated membrane glycoprotein 1 [Coregonus clupeaformis]
MKQHSRKQLLSLAFIAFLAVTLHQSFAATDVPPTAAAPQTTALPPAPPARPERGNYTVTNGNGTVCLMARMGLQLNIRFSSASLNNTVQDVVNLQPNVTKSSGSCDSDSATLMLMADEEKTNLTFLFSLNATSSKYHLSGVILSAVWLDMSEPFSASNSSLDYLRGTLGHSYVCHEEQTLAVAVNFSLNTFQLQVQPFGLTRDQFGAAEECQLDEDDMLIPIIVGAALASLVLIVLVAYLIGRKRSHAGYQTI